MLLRLLFLIVLLPGASFASVSVSVNGSNYTIPQTNEKGWGTNVTTWIQQISSHTLQNNGGTFTLTGDVDFGASFGLKAPYYISKSTNPASSGAVRLANADSVSFRNSTNNADLALKPDVTDGVIDYNSVPLVGTSLTQTLTNKTIAFGSNTFSGTLSLSNGGTNASLTSIAGGPVYSTASGFAILSSGTSGQLLTSGGSGAPTWTTNNFLTSAITSLNGQTNASQVFANDTNVTITSSNNTHSLGFSGTLALGRGGTGNNITASAGGVVYASSTSALNTTAAGTAGQILLSGGAGSPTFSAPLFTPGTNNLVLGPGNLASLSTGSANTIFGYSAGTAITSGSNNLFFGAFAGQNVSQGSQNTLIGASAGSSITTTGQTTAIGYNADLQGTGAQNTFIGVSSGPQSSGAGANNVGVGYGAGNAITSGARNTMLGQQTGNATNTTSDNTYVGYQSGFTCNQSNNTIVGSSSDCGANTYSNVTIVGKGISASASNQAIFGNSTEQVGLAGATPSTSSAVIVPAGTTSVAPFRIPSGTNTTSAVSGNLEYDGTQFYFTNSTPTRQTVLKTPDSITGGTVVYSNGTDAKLTAVGTAGQILQSNGGSAPTWVTVAGLTYTNPTIQKFTSTGTATGYACIVSSANATVGATYTNNANTFTVQGTISAGTLIFFSGTGTLSGSTFTKSGGTGDATITSSACYTSATYTKPTSPAPIYIRVRMAGGGGGGASSGTASTSSGGAGNPSYFGVNLLVANGGGGGTVGGGGTCSGGTTSIAAGPIGYGLTGGLGQGGSNNNSLGMYVMGGMGGSNEFGGPGGTNGAGSDGKDATGYGGGGGGASTGAVTTANDVSGGGGCAGGFINAIINSPSSTYPYVVGGNGTGGSFGTNGHNGGNGAFGVVIVEEYYQ